MCRIMDDKIYILDTNAARQLPQILGDNPEKQAAIISKRMLEMNMRFYLSPIVIMELLSHINHGNPDFPASYRAIRSLILIGESFPKNMRYVACPADIIIANLIWGQSIKSRADMYNDFVGVACNIAHQNIDDVASVKTTEGDSLEDFQYKMRCSFVEHLKNVMNAYQKENVLQKAKNDYTFEQAALYGTLLGMVYELMAKDNKIENINSELESARKNNQWNRVCCIIEKIKYDCDLVYANYPSLRALLVILVKKIIDSNMQMANKKIANYLQDLYLSFHINQAFDCGRSILVTDDKTILDSTKQAGVNCGIIKYEDFKSTIAK